MKKFGNLFFTESGDVFLSNGERYPIDERRYRKNGTFDGYKYVRVNGNLKPIHRIIAKLYVKNPNPEKFNIVDHINRIRSDNRACNLRFVSNFLNSHNKDTITAKFDNDIKMWTSSIWCKGEEMVVGFFTSFLACHLATRNARYLLFERLYKDAVPDEAGC